MLEEILSLWQGVKSETFAASQLSAKLGLLFSLLHLNRRVNPSESDFSTETILDKVHNWVQKDWIPDDRREELMAAKYLARMNPSKLTDAQSSLLKQYPERGKVEHARITTKKLAEGIGVSPRVLQRTFEKIGTKLGKYILMLRCQQGFHLLEKWNLSVTEVSQDLGFPTVSAFDKAFHRTYGHSPKMARLKFDQNTKIA